MAINDKENPEEGTPRSKKDIRKERRQMKSIDRQRKAMGGEPLYVKEDYEAIKKPFKPAPGTEMTGFVNKREGYQDVKLVKEGDSPTRVQNEDKTFMVGSKERVEKRYGPTYNQSNIVEETKPDVEYIRAGYGSGEKESKEFRKTFKAETTEAEEIRKDSEAGQQIIKTLANTPNPSQETQDILQVKADNNPNLTSTDQENLTKANQEVGNEVKNLNDAITNQEITDKNAISNIDEVVQSKPGQDGWIDTYVTESFEPEDKNTILARAAAAARKKAPQLAIEKLGVQDYYPDIGRNIAVGTFTGSRIGSQTIYSGAGGVLPLGLYDARKRAIAADIKKKQALMDELKQMPDIAKQYKPAFAQNFYNGLMDYVDAYKDNPEGLASDPGYLKFMSTQKGVAENFSKTSAYLKDLEEKLVDPKTGKPAAWVTKDMMAIINNVKTGMVPGKIEDYFSGKKNIAKVLDTVRALPNALNQADEIVKTLIKDGAIERAINLKTGKDFNPEELEDLNNLIQKLNSPSPDYEVFSELKRKFFYFEFDKIAEEWVKNNMADQSDKVKEEVEKSMASYMFEQMPKESIISTITKQANDAAERLGDQLDYQKAMARINADKEMFYADFNRHTSITRALYEGMERLGSNDESVEIYDAGVNGKNGLEMEWQVYDSKDKAYKWVKGKDINANTGRYYKSDKISKDNVYTALPVVHVQPTKNNMKKSGSNYNVSTYGVAYESFTDMGDGSKVGAAQISVPVRTPYATAVQGGKLNDGVIGSSDNAVGAKFQRTAGNIYTGGGKEKVGGSSSQHNRVPE